MLISKFMKTKMRILTLLLCLIPSILTAGTTLHSEDWEAYAALTSLDAGPPNWVLDFQDAGGTGTVVNHEFGSKAGRVDGNGAKWAYVALTTFTVTDGSFIARIDSPRFAIGIRDGGTNNGAGQPTSGVHGEYIDSLTLLRIMIAGAGGIATVVLVSDNSFSVPDPTDYTMKIEVIGTTINLYVNGTLELTTTDSTWTSGGISMTSFGFGEADDLLVQDNAAVSAFTKVTSFTKTTAFTKTTSFTKITP